MQRFRYSLQKILDLREFELRQAEAELGKVNAQIAGYNEQLKTIASQKHTVQHSVDETHDVIFFANAHDYFILLEQRKNFCMQQIALLEIEAEKRKEVVRAAMKKKKILEKLKEHRFADWKAENLKAEELVTDDVVTAKYNNLSAT